MYRMGDANIILMLICDKMKNMTSKYIKMRHGACYIFATQKCKKQSMKIIFPEISGKEQ